MRGYVLTAVRFDIGHDSWFARVHSRLRALPADF